jgi:hypothetical protein
VRKIRIIEHISLDAVIQAPRPFAFLRKATKGAAASIVVVPA